MDTRAMMEGTKAGVDKQAKRQRTNLLAFDAIDYALMQLQSYEQSWLSKNRQISVKKVDQALLHSRLSHICTKKKKERRRKK